MLATTQLPFGGSNAASLLLAHKGVKVYLADPHLAKTALHYASEFGSLDLVKACCAVKPEMLNDPDATRLTPWLLAARGGHADVVHFMLDQPQLCCDARDWLGVLRAFFRERECTRTAS
jgi:ankyrin repeat protein